MKKLIICLTVAAFALVPALQAGEECAKNKAACADKAKGTSCSDKAKGASCSEEAKSGCASACAKSVALKKAVKAGTKGATLLVQR